MRHTYARPATPALMAHVLNWHAVLRKFEAQDCTFEVMVETDVPLTHDETESIKVFLVDQSKTAVLQMARQLEKLIEPCTLGVTVDIGFYAPSETD
jgi:hypothetical protein